MLTGYRRRQQAEPPLPPTIAALLRLRGEGAGRDEMAFRLIDRTTDTIATATYEELYRRSAWVAHELARYGVRPGDPVVLFLESCLEFPYGLFGALLLGALPAAVAPPLDPRGHGAAPEHLRHVVGQLGARMVLSSRGHGRLAEPVCRAFAATPLLLDRVGESDGEGLPGEGVAGDEPVLLQYTSGTRGDPKPIALSTRALLTNLRAVGDAFTITEGDVGLSWLPLHHDMGLQSVFFSLAFRMPLVLMAPSEFLRCPAAWLRAISRYGVTHSPAPPFGYLYAAQRIREEELAGVDLSRWRVAMCGADIIPAAGLEGFAARFAHLGFRPSALLAAYGLAEHTVAVSFGRPGGGLRVDALAGRAREAMGGGRTATADSPLTIVSVGRPIAGHGVRVVDAAGREVPDGTQGEIQVCGPSQMLEYRGDETATRRARDGRWLWTGDLGYVRDGELFVTGFKEDLLPQRGRVYHAHLIEAAATIDGLRPGAVVAFSWRSSATATEEIVAVAEVQHGDDPGRSALSDRVAQSVSAALGAVVDRVVLVGRGGVPRTTSGKLRRRECRRRFEAGRLASPQTAGVTSEGTDRP